MKYELAGSLRARGNWPNVHPASPRTNIQADINSSPETRLDFVDIRRQLTQVFQRLTAAGWLKVAIEQKKNK